MGEMPEDDSNRNARAADDRLAATDVGVAGDVILVGHRRLGDRGLSSIGI